MSEPNESDYNLFDKLYGDEYRMKYGAPETMQIILSHRESIEAPLKARIKDLEALAYLGEHHFPDLTYKERLEELVSNYRKLEAELAAERAKLERMREALVLSAEIFDKVRIIEQYESWEGGSPDLGTARTLGRIKEISKIARAALDAERGE